MNIQRKVIRKTLICSTSAVLALSLCLTPMLSSGVHAAAAGGANYYESDYQTKSQVFDAATQLRSDVYAEGITLLKNDDQALPLQKGASISIFGKMSMAVFGHGDIDLRMALIEKPNDPTRTSYFNENYHLSNFYWDSNQSGTGWQNDSMPWDGNIASATSTWETPVSMYGDELKATFSQFNEAAFVCFYRYGAEGTDASRTQKWDGESFMWNENSTEKLPEANSEDDHYLQLTAVEADLLDMVSEYFDKIIIILQTPSSFDTSFLTDPGHYAYHEEIKAALMITNSCPRDKQLADIIVGNTSPSGRTVDTFARDFKLDPTWQNFGNNRQLLGNQYANLPNATGGYRNNYVTYNEGIYVGYRYWETRGYTEGYAPYTSATEGEKTSYIDEQTDGSLGKSKDYIHNTSTTEWDSWYDAHVSYPFGYGLSYTTFDQEIVSATPGGTETIGANDTISVNVKVTNTGSYAGKEVVQLYYTPPYTDGGIEKSHVVLAAFAKTKLLQPGGSETLTLTFKARDMASYDYSDANKNGFKGYELEAGEYIVRLMKNAHEAFDGEEVVYRVAETVKLENDDNTGNKTENRFDDVSNYITGELGEKYLSRSDWEGTWPKANIKLTASSAVQAGLKEWEVNAAVPQRDPKADESEAYYSDTMPTTKKQQGIVLTDLYGKTYDDPLWETFMDQFSVEQYAALVTGGYYAAGISLEEFGVKPVGNFDGPRTWSVRNSQDEEEYPYLFSPIILSLTWNVELAERYGDIMAEIALWSKGAGDGIGGWYAPAVNIHRSPFGGRNWEYFSEDGLFAGKMAAGTVKGAQNKGLPVYVKHFALNEMETNREGLLTWANEQCMREIYFKPFEICVKEANTLGIMSGLNRIGTTWTGGSYELLTQVLRDEWGFEGVVVTDMYLGDSSNLSNADQMIRAGGDLALGNAKLLYNYNYDNPDASTPTTVSVLRKGAKNILWMLVHSAAELNTAEQGSRPIKEFSGRNLNVGVYGQEYSDQLVAVIDTVAYPDAKPEDVKYELVKGDDLPTGLYLSTDGKIYGTPVQSLSNWTFPIKATLGDYSTVANFTITVVPETGGLAYMPDNTDLGTVTVGDNSNLSVACAELWLPTGKSENAAITYSLKPGISLPEGLTLASDGKITGKATKQCASYTFTVLASADGYSTVSADFTLAVRFGLSFDGATMPAGKIGVTYFEHLPEATSQNNVTFELASRLPTGLYLTPGGYLAGTPRECVTDYTFRVVAKAEDADPVTVEMKISIGLSFNDATLPEAATGEEYTAHVDTAQGASDVKYSLKSGSVLPEGLTLSESGIITGTPVKEGVYEITVVASADGKVSDEITLSLTVNGSSSLAPMIIAGVAIGVVAVVAVVATAVVLSKKKGNQNGRS